MPSSTAEAELHEELQRRAVTWAGAARVACESRRLFTINKERLLHFKVVDHAGRAQLERWCGARLEIVPGSVHSVLNGTASVYVDVRPVGTTGVKPQTINFLLLVPAPRPDRAQEQSH